MWVGLRLGFEIEIEIALEIEMEIGLVHMDYKMDYFQDNDTWVVDRLDDPFEVGRIEAVEGLEKKSLQNFFVICWSFLVA